jgi:hypothetical protein
MGSQFPLSSQRLLNACGKGSSSVAPRSRHAEAHMTTWRYRECYSDSFGPCASRRAIASAGRCIFAPYVVTSHANAGLDADRTLLQRTVRRSFLAPVRYRAPQAQSRTSPMDTTGLLPQPTSHSICGGS